MKHSIFSLYREVPRLSSANEVLILPSGALTKAQLLHKLLEISGKITFKSELLSTNN